MYGTDIPNGALNSQRATGNNADLHAAGSPFCLFSAELEDELPYARPERKTGSASNVSLRRWAAVSCGRITLPASCGSPRPCGTTCCTVCACDLLAPSLAYKNIVNVFVIKRVQAREKQRAKSFHFCLAGLETERDADEVHERAEPCFKHLHARSDGLTPSCRRRSYGRPKHVFYSSTAYTVHPPV